MKLFHLGVNKYRKMGDCLKHLKLSDTDYLSVLEYFVCESFDVIVGAYSGHKG